MNSIELISSVPKLILRKKYWICSNCQRVYIDKEVADKCCLCLRCKNLIVADDLTTQALYAPLYHTKCENLNREDFEQSRIDKAEKLEKWNSWVFWNDKFYPDVDSFLDENYTECEKIGGGTEDVLLNDLPEYIFCCKEVPFRKVYLDSIISEICEDSYENAEDDIVGQEDLEKALNKFNELNKSLKSYEPNYNKVVKVKK